MKKQIIDYLNKKVEIEDEEMFKCFKEWIIYESDVNLSDKKIKWMADLIKSLGVSKDFEIVNYKPFPRPTFSQEFGFLLNYYEDDYFWRRFFVNKADPFGYGYIELKKGKVYLKWHFTL